MNVPASGPRIAIVVAAFVQACAFPADPPPGSASGSGSSALVVPSTIPVLMEDGSTVQMDLEEYLKGVLPREMGPSFPAEALKAQAVAARNFALDYTRNGKAICTTTLCQVWGPERFDETDAAVEATRGVVATVDDRVVAVFFSASCGGYTRNVEDVWHGDALPWLRGVPCIENRTDACDAVCTPDQPASADCWGVLGHRVGLCQRGAQAMAECGSSYAEILGHYLTGVVLSGAPAPADGMGGDEAHDLAAPDLAASDLALPDAGPGEGIEADEAGAEDAAADTPAGDTFVPRDVQPSTDPDNGPWGCSASGPGVAGTERGSGATASILLLAALSLAALPRRRRA